jgi:hypothetical protein
LGSEDLFSKRKENIQRRRTELIEQRKSTWLIVSEGTKTEVNYFNSLNEYMNKNGKRKIELKPVGTGVNTIGVVNKVNELFNIADREIR